MDLKSSVYADMFLFTRFKHIKHQHLPAITVFIERIDFVKMLQASLN